MTDESAWREEDRVDLAELDQAMAGWDTGGQNDPTGGDAGAEAELGHDPEVRDAPNPAPSTPPPGTTGRTGPN
jgi:hypothetical protein